MRRKIGPHKVFVHEEGEGPTRLFIHCSLGRHESLIPLARLLPPARDLFFDMPGHGRSGPWRGTQYQTDVYEIGAELLDAPAHVIGHSFGATAALRLAIERPELVSRLTLIEPVMFAAATDPDAVAAHRATFAPFAAAWEAGDRDAAARLFVGMWGTGPDWADLPAKMRAALADQIYLIPAGGASIEEDVHGILPRLDRVRCLVDLIEGADSQPIMPHILDGLVKGLPQARRHVIDGAGHMVPITHVEKVAAAISAV